MNRAERGTLLGLLALAALLRFWALGWGLSRTPHVDESDFVGNVARMLQTGSLDHEYYEYPGLIFYLLMPVLKVVGAGFPPDARAYLAARAFIAVCGVTAVGLAALLGLRLAGARAGLAAAAFLAVSPVHVETAHMFRPDVTLELFLLLLLLACLRVGTSLRFDALAGLALGLAVGTKFSGALGLVPYATRRLLAPGPRWRGLLLAGSAAALVFVVVSPYALLHGQAFVAGASSQLRYHYARDLPDLPPYPLRLLGYAHVWWDALGPVGALLAAVGLVLALRRETSVWLGLLALPLVTAAVFATTEFHFARHMLPSLGIPAILAGLALQSLAARYPAPAGLLAIVALTLPLRASLQYLEQIQRPTTRDRVVELLRTRLPGPARVVTTVNSLGLDRRLYEALHVKQPGRLFALQAAEADALVGQAGDRRPQPDSLWTAASEVWPASPYEGPLLFVRFRAAARHEPRWLSLAGARLEASDNPQDLEFVRDGSLATAWRVAAEDARGAWLTVSWPAAVRLARVELRLGEPAGAPGLNLSVRVSSDGRVFRAWPSAAARPRIEDQLAGVAAPSELLVFPTAEVRALRLDRRAARRPWTVAELRVAGP